MSLDGLFPRKSLDHGRSTSFEALELVTGWAMLEAALWTTVAYQALIGAAAIAAMAAFNYVSGYTAWQQGFSPRANRRAMWLVLAAFLIAAAIVAAGRQAGTLHDLPGIEHPLPRVLGYLVWAFIQEWMALGFVLVRLERLLPGRYAVLACAAIFSGAHLPNAVLMALTFAMSAAFAVLFRRYRALVPVAIAHALLGLALAVAMPASLTHVMRVGAAYVR